MSDTAVHPEPPSPTDDHTPTVRATLAIDLVGGFDAALRLLIVLRRRNCTATGIEFRSHEQHLSVVVEMPSARAHCVPHWLASLVEVRSVTILDDVAAATAPGAPC